MTEGVTTGDNAEPKLEQVTLPPAPRGTDDTPSTTTSDTPAKKADSSSTKSDGAARPREVEAPKKKGKKGSNEP